MPHIKIVNNPFNYGDPAWEDPYGRVGIRIEDENSVKWYNCFTESGRSYILDELMMIIDEPFNCKESTWNFSIDPIFGVMTVNG